MKENTIWLGETTCNICGDPCEHVLYDGMTKMGPWAVMCPKCFEHFGMSTGKGFGQGYKKNSKGEFEKFIG